MESVASHLKSEREKRNISLAQIAADTRISLRHLQSLEEGRFGDLPGGMYNRAFVRAYCESLKLDQKDIMRRYEDEMHPQAERSPRSKTHIPRKNSSLRISPIIIWCIMLLVSATGLFFSRNYIASIFSPYFSRTPAPNVPFEPPKEPPAETPVSAAQPTAQTAAPSDASQESALPTEVPAPVSGIQEGTAADSSVPDAGHSFRLEIVGTAKCWVSIDRDGSPALRKVIEPGEVQSFSAAERFLIIVGNAGGVSLKVNGKPLKPLGQSGEVRRISIDQQSLPELLDPTAG